MTEPRFDRRTFAAIAGAGLVDVGRPHRPARARRMVWLMQNGGPSHVDLFDPKPELIRRAGEDLPESVRAGQRCRSCRIRRASTQGRAATCSPTCAR